MDVVISIDEFLLSKRQERRSAGTIVQYRKHLGYLRCYLEDAGIRCLSEVDRNRLRWWCAGLNERWEPATVRLSVSTVKMFFTWCVAEGYLDESPAETLKIPRVPIKLQRTLSAEEICRLIQACDTMTVKGIRDAAIVSLLADSGLRVSELLSLTPDDLDLSGGRLAVIRKGGAQSSAFFGRATAIRLNAWLGVRAPAPFVTALWVSVGGTKTGQLISASGLRAGLKKFGEQAGVPAVTPHAFRRAWACMLVEAGAPVRFIQSAGGWTSERQIYRYTQALETERLARMFSPIDRLDRLNGHVMQLPLWAELPK